MIRITPLLLIGFLTACQVHEPLNNRLEVLVPAPQVPALSELNLYPGNVVSWPVDQADAPDIAPHFPFMCGGVFFPDEGERSRVVATQIGTTGYITPLDAAYGHEPTLIVYHFRLR